MSLKHLANETLQLLEAGVYETSSGRVEFRDLQEEAVACTRLYTPDELALLRSRTAEAERLPQVQIIDATTQVAAKQMAAEVAATGGSLALLNFASARNPGGGFLNGAKAQEEDLCRCSGLYPCLLTCMEYYEANRGQASLLYTDHAIYSPRVPFFKTRGTGEFLDQPFVASVITCPAPNSGPFLRSHPGAEAELEAAFLRRWENVLAIARDQAVTDLLLGAWGCGAFGGDPKMAASTARTAIERQAFALNRIIFAIPSQGRQSRANLDAFRRELDSLTNGNIA